MRVAVLKGGRSLERRCRCAPAHRCRTRSSAAGHDVVAIDVGAELVRAAARRAPDVAFIALHGRDGEDGTVQELLEAISASPTRAPGPRRACAATDKVLAKHLLREARLPTPDFYALREARSGSSASRQRAPGGRAPARLPDGREAREPGLGARGEVRALERGASGAIVGAFSYDRKVLLERYVDGRDLAVLDARRARDGGARPWRSRSSRRSHAKRTSTTSRRATRSGAPTSSARPSSRALAERAQELALAAYALLGCRGFARVDLMLEQQDEEMYVLEANVVPGLTETSLLPQAADAAGIDFDELVERVLASVARTPRERRVGRSAAARRPDLRRRAQESPAAKSSGETSSRNSLNFSMTSSLSSTSCSNSIADSAMTSSAA